jgi:hypothetical protein
MSWATAGSPASTRTTRSSGLGRPRLLAEGDGLAAVLTSSELIQNEASDIDSRNRRRDWAGADSHRVAAGACRRRNPGRTDNGKVESALADLLLLQFLVCIRPPYQVLDIIGTETSGLRILSAPQLPIGRSARGDHLRPATADDRHLGDPG